MRLVHVVGDVRNLYAAFFLGEVEQITGPIGLAVMGSPSAPLSAGEVAAVVARLNAMPAAERQQLRISVFADASAAGDRAAADRARRRRSWPYGPAEAGRWWPPGRTWTSRTWCGRSAGSLAGLRWGGPGGVLLKRRCWRRTGSWRRTSGPGRCGLSGCGSRGGWSAAARSACPAAGARSSRITGQRPRRPQMPAPGPVSGGGACVRPGPGEIRRRGQGGRRGNVNDFVTALRKAGWAVGQGEAQGAWNTVKNAREASGRGTRSRPGLPGPVSGGRLRPARTWRDSPPAPGRQA